MFIDQFLCVHVLIGVLPRNRINIQRSSFKKSTHAVVELWWLQNLMGKASRLETQERGALWVCRQFAGRIPSSYGEVSLPSIKASTDWMRSTHIMESNQHYSQSIYLNVNLIQKSALKETFSTIFDQISEADYKTNHHVHTYLFCYLSNIPN